MQKRPSGSASLRLQILASEHWSLLATRSLTYSESLTRVVIFLSVLSGAVVSLALIAQVDRFREMFAFAAVVMLSVVLFVGIATVLRLSELNCEDMHSVCGMNRLRRGYADMQPELERYFVSGTYDDLRGLMLTLNMDMVPGRWSAGDIAHGFQTLPAMLAVIVSVVAAALGGLIAASVGAQLSVAMVIAAASFAVTITCLTWWTRHAFIAFVDSMPTRFPSKDERVICRLDSHSPRPVTSHAAIRLVGNGDGRCDIARMNTTGDRNGPAVGNMSSTRSS